MDVFQDHNPLKVSCLSSYDPMVTELLRFWRYEDTQEDLKTYIVQLCIQHSGKQVQLSQQMLQELHACRSWLL